MPELPEVETTARGIAPHVEGNLITQVVVRQRQLRWPVPPDLETILRNVTVRSVYRRAKYLLFATDVGSVILHLGMSGSLRILPAGQEVIKHDHIDFIFSNGTLLRYNDPRRFGAVLWTCHPITDHVLFNSLGPEPLLSEFDGRYLHHQAINRKTPIKSFIMDSRIVVGVGNIYANEALFMAGIHPLRQAGEVSLQQHDCLVRCIKEVLQFAIQQGGTTLRNFVNEAGKPGYFKQQLRVYGRGGMPCVTCSKLLTEIRIANRTTVFCNQCQQ